MQATIPRAMTALTPSQLNLVTARRKFGQKKFPVISLDFDNAVPGRAAGTAAFFKECSDLLQPRFRERNPAYNCDRLAATAFAFAPDPDNAVTCGLTVLLAANAAVYRAGAVRTDPAGVG